jgi:hypothetical protein
MLRHSTDGLSVRLAAPHADCEAEGADVNQGFARGSYDNSDAPALAFSKGPSAHKFFPSRNWPEAALRKLVGA